MRIAACILILAGSAMAQDVAKKAPAGPGLTLTSTSFADGGEIPTKYTQSVSQPISPQLAWINVPAATVSFALIMHDPDAAPQRKTDDVLHWLMFNIPASQRELPEGRAPQKITLNAIWITLAGPVPLI
jgi:phosphatidylethanolamine-binding protein (PEBP) family uncharacterized protein